MANRVNVILDGGNSTVGGTWSMGLNFATDRLPTTPEATVIADAIMQALTTNSAFKLGISSLDQVNNIRLFGHSPANAPASVSGQSSAALFAGTGNSAVLTPQVAVAVTLRSGLPGRSYRGRVYYPARAVTVAANGELAVGGTAETTLAASLNAFKSACNTAMGANGISSTWVIYSKTQVAMTPVSHLSVGSRVDTIRRRNEGVETYTDFPLT